MERLTEGQTLYSNSNSTLESRCRKFTLIVQHDGNLVVYAGKVFTPDYAVWASGTNGVGVGPYRLTMQADGNLCLYDTKKCVWASNSHNNGVKGGYECKLRPNGQLCVFDKFKQITYITKATLKVQHLPDPQSFSRRGGFGGHVAPSPPTHQPQTPYGGYQPPTHQQPPYGHPGYGGPSSPPPPPHGYPADPYQQQPAYGQPGYGYQQPAPYTYPQPGVGSGYPKKYY